MEARRLIAVAVMATGVVFGGLAACNAPPPASAAPACEHRGMDHIKRHGGKEEDDRFHLSHGQRVTCDGPDEEKGDLDPYERHDGEDEHPHDDGRKHDNEPGDGTPLYRDHEGFSCYHLHCG